MRERILLTLGLVKFPGHRVFLKPESMHYKKINKTVANTISFYSEFDDHAEVNFSGETTTSNWQLVKI